MLRVALTGGIATGKSYVLDRFRRRGVPCLDADELAHGVRLPAPRRRRRSPRGSARTCSPPTDRSIARKLGPIVFADAAARRELEAIVHPGRVPRDRGGGARVRVARRLRDRDRRRAAAYETGRQQDFDRRDRDGVPVDTQLARLIERGLTDAARQRLAAQGPTEKSRPCRFRDSH